MSSKKNKISDKSIVRNFSFLLQINYNEFNFKILYTDGVGWKKIQIFYNIY
jgi:hypothetical protein